MRKELKIIYHLFLFQLFLLLIMVSLFLRKKAIKNQMQICYSYSIIFSLFEQFSLIIEYNKSEVFHFSRTKKNYNLPFLDLWLLGKPLLCPKNKWKYFGFIFDRKLLFCHHIHFYSKKALSTIKNVKMLGNSTMGLLPSHQ